MSRPTRGYLESNRSNQSLRVSRSYAPKSAKFVPCQCKSSTNITASIDKSTTQHFISSHHNPTRRYRPLTATDHFGGFHFGECTRGLAAREWCVARAGSIEPFAARHIEHHSLHTHVNGTQRVAACTLTTTTATTTAPYGQPKQSGGKIRVFPTLPLMKSINPSIAQSIR